MIDFCILVTSIVGAWCFSDAPAQFTPPGDCVFVDTQYICIVDTHELQVRPTFYNPMFGGLNCVDPCDQLGDGTPVSESYGRFAACPVGWYGRTIEFTVQNQSFIRQCRDHGGDVHPKCGEIFIPANGREYHCFITVDFVEHSAPWFALLLVDWELLK